MTKGVTLRQAGGSVSATLPKDMADRLRLEAGDRVLAIETDRGILLTPYDPETERALQVAAKAAKKYRNALRALAYVFQEGPADLNAGDSPTRSVRLSELFSGPDRSVVVYHFIRPSRSSRETVTARSATSIPRIPGWPRISNKEESICCHRSTTSWT